MGSRCPLGYGAARARHRAERSSVTSQRPLSQKECQTHVPHESVHVPLPCSTTDTAQAAHAQAQLHVTPTWFHSFISFQFISFHFISFHFISFHFISFHFISFHFISAASLSTRGTRTHSEARVTTHARCTASHLSQVVRSARAPFLLRLLLCFSVPSLSLSSLTSPRTVTCASFSSVALWWTARACAARRTSGTFLTSLRRYLESAFSTLVRRG